MTVLTALSFVKFSSGQLRTTSDAICHSAASPSGLLVASIPKRIACSLRIRPA